MLDAVLDVNIVDGPFIVIVSVLAAAAALYLLGRRPTGAWIVTVIVTVVTAGLLAFGLLWAVEALGTFGGPVDASAWVWVPAAFAGCGLAIVNLRHSRWWRKTVALASIPLFILTATLGVNAAYGLNPTIGSFLHISTAKPIAIPAPNGETTDPATPLSATWKPPADLPAAGRSGLIPGGIPNTGSGFSARPAEIYLPPAALVKNPPRLPLVIMMMGQPGDPDPEYIGGVLDDFAADHSGLAPIVVVIDQLGDPLSDPLCLDSPRGNVETYVMQDVVPWASANLNVLRGRQYWTIAGFSNGGQCALYFGAKYPQVFGAIVDVSGVEYAGEETHDRVLDEIFGGDQAAYEQVKPATIMAASAPYPDTTAVFTVGERDTEFGPGAERNAEAARAAGMAVTFTEIAGTGHTADALVGGLETAFDVLYPRLGLSP